MVTTIEMMRKPAMSAALMKPSATPMTPAKRRPTSQSPPPSAMSARKLRYWTTEAATAKEMSIPPEINTMSRPTAQITLMALLFINEVRLEAERKLGEAKERKMINAAKTTRSLA